MYIAHCAQLEVEGEEQSPSLRSFAQKYEGTPTPSQTSAPILHPGAPPKTRRSGQAKRTDKLVLKQG